MIVTVGEIKRALAPIDGCTFADLEELENAVLPLFGQLQAAMLGKSYRDLVDMLITKGWIKRDRFDCYTIKFPSEQTQTSTDKMSEPPAESPKVHVPIEFRPRFSYREIALLVHLHSNEVTRIDMGFASLISVGMVEYANIADPLPDSEIAGIKRNIQAGKTQAVSFIFNEEFMNACDICQQLREAQNDLNSTDMVYRLTEMGKAYMQDQADSILER